jgi:hypothetical protein
LPYYFLIQNKTNPAILILGEQVIAELPLNNGAAIVRTWQDSVTQQILFTCNGQKHDIDCRAHVMGGWAD